MKTIDKFADVLSNGADIGSGRRAAVSDVGAPSAGRGYYSSPTPVRRSSERKPGSHWIIATEVQRPVRVGERHPE